jgi:hypothetical protein
MRDEDTSFGKPASEELRDIHKRIDTLHSESESQYKTITERLHAIELRVIEGRRFPVMANIGIASILVVVLGGGFALYAEVKQSGYDSGKALALIEEHLKAAPTHRYNVESLTKFADDLKDRVPKLEADVDLLKGRIVGNSSDGWHRRDHELYAELVAARFAAIEQRMTAQEQRSVQRDAWWQRLWDSGALKGAR